MAGLSLAPAIFQKVVPLLVVLSAITLPNGSFKALRWFSILQEETNVKIGEAISTMSCQTLEEWRPRAMANSNSEPK